MTKKGKTFHYTSLAINLLEKLINPKFNVDGVEKIPQKPVLFVANHFTRFETFIIPYIIHKYTHRQVRCLADSGLFKGGFGDFLTNVGTLSTTDPDRNKTIISDLMSGDYDWMIYPEGAMVKSKEIYSKGGFISHTPYGVSRAKTGATVLALKSELYRQELIRAKKENNQEIIDFYEKSYDVKYKDRLKEVDTHIVPINITYYPIRPGENIIKKVAQSVLKRLPRKIAEELEIEGNLILSANINVSFGEAIRVADYSRKARSLVRKIPLMKNKSKSNLVISYLKYRLTSKIMEEIYFDTKINLDHLFTAVLFKYKEESISINHLKNIIYSAAVNIQKTNKYRLSHSILEHNLIKIFNDEPHKELDGVIALAKSLKIVKESADGQFLVINKSKINQKHDFHDIRKENTLQVIFNEFALLKTANLAVKRSMIMSDIKLKKEVFQKILKADIQNFLKDYHDYYDDNLSKQAEIGSPFFLNSNSKNKDVGIVLCHGYQSAPEEVRQLAIHLNGLGFRVYAVRLKGHGTSPQNIQDVSYHDWYNDISRGYSALSRICSKIIIIGFSTGGLLSLLSCAKKPQNSIFAVITINAALKLQDIRARYIVPGITIWNDLLNKFKIKKATLEYIENNSENPLVNYPRNYLSGVGELGKLMSECSSNLSKVSNPALIIYSKNDPIVKPDSSKIIQKEIKSDIKELKEFDMDNHIIIFGDNNKKVFDVIEKFIFKLLAS